MQHYPLMDVHFPPARENELHDEMKSRTRLPWTSQTHNAFGKAPEGHFYFHRASFEGSPACTLCILRKKPGHWTIHAIVPDEGHQPDPIPIDQYKAILSEFEALIAEPAASVVHGLSAIQVSEHRLEDFFSPKSIRLLRRFCQTSNQSDFGTHPSDQEKWMEFLICVFDDRSAIHCDIFGECLRNEACWPEAGIQRLVREYDFAMRLLKQRLDSEGAI